jgi:hypothetical protein
MTIATNHLIVCVVAFSLFQWGCFNDNDNDNDNSDDVDV